MKLDDVLELRQRPGEKLFARSSAFRSLCRNGDEENAKEHQLFLTEQTMQSIDSAAIGASAIAARAQLMSQM